MKNDFEQKYTISTYHLKQHELVNFLYDRFTVGMMFTLIVALVVTSLVTIELSLQGLEYRGYIWFAGLLVIQYFRYRLKKNYDQVKTVDYLRHEYWKNRFIIGVYVIALWQGIGAVFAMPMISDNLQYIIHVSLLGLGAGAIAYLATSMVFFVPSWCILPGYQVFTISIRFRPFFFARRKASSARVIKSLAEIFWVTGIQQIPTDRVIKALIFERSCGIARCRNN